MGTKKESGLTDEQARHLAGVLRQHLERYESGVAMARAWGISQSQLSQLMGGHRKGAGIAVLCRIRRHTGMSIDSLLGLPPLRGEISTAEMRRLVVDVIHQLATETGAETPSLPPAKRRP